MKRLCYKYLFQDGKAEELSVGQTICLNTSEQPITLLDLERNNIIKFKRTKNTDSFSIPRKFVLFKPENSYKYHCDLVLNDSNVWYSCRINNKESFKRKKEMKMVQNGEDCLLAITAEDDLTIPNVLDDWWLKPEWKKIRRLYYPTTSMFNVVTARYFVREAQKQPCRILRKNHLQIAKIIMTNNNNSN